MTQPVDAVLFDIDDTLCSYRRSGAELLALAYERAGVDPIFTIEEYHDRYRRYAATNENMPALREECFADLAGERGHDPSVGREIARVYADERDHANVEWCPGAREALRELHGDVPLAAVTNGAPEMQSVKLDALGAGDRFETVVHAGYDAPPKPEPDAFHLALDALEVAPERALHVGNSLSSDVAGGVRAGVRTAWIPNGSDRTDPDPQPDYVLDSVGELPARTGLSPRR